MLVKMLQALWPLLSPCWFFLVSIFSGSVSMKAHEMLLFGSCVCPHEAGLEWRPRTLSDWPCRKGLCVPRSFFERPLVLTYLLRKLRPQNGFRTTIGVLEKKVTKCLQTFRFNIWKCIQDIKSKHVCKHFIKGEFAWKDIIFSYSKRC